MKKSIRRLITVFAVCAVSVFAAMASGCSLTDKIKEKIEQVRCEHEWNDGEVTKEATCMKKGELTKTCTLCEKVETEKIELAEHIAVYVQAVTPTCIEKGVTDGTVCSVCETKISGFQEIPALGHIVVKDSAVEPTCLEEGLTEGEYCSRCNEVLKAQKKVPAAGHELVTVDGYAATCTNSGSSDGVKCSTCGLLYVQQEPIPALGHSYDDGVVMTAATCTVVGVMTYTCENCEGVKNESIPALGHDYVDKLCTRCGGEQVSPYAYYSETSVESGTPVAEKVYRFYKSAKTSGDWANMIVIKDSFSLLDSAGNVVERSELYFGVDFDTYEVDEPVFIIGTEPVFGSSDIIADISTSIEYYETDEYIDVVLKVGDTFTLESVYGGTGVVLSGTITISANATVGTFGTPYCLVASEE